MEAIQFLLSKEEILSQNSVLEKSKLALVFGIVEEFSADKHDKIHKYINSDNVVYCSTSGHFIDQLIEDEKFLIIKYAFDDTEIKCAAWNVKDFSSEADIGSAFKETYEAENLRHIMIFSDGHIINSDLLLAGFNTAGIDKEVSMSGGIAGDGINFNSTRVGLNIFPQEGVVVAVGFYSQVLRVESRITSGFQEFGPKRIVTDSHLNVLSALDGQPALDLYKTYLGDLAENLPGSALYFPLAIFHQDGSSTIRTILNVNEDNKSMTFAGNIPKGSTVSLMRANVDMLLDAAEETNEDDLPFSPQHIFITSCVGRRIIMGSRTNEELYIIKEAYPDVPVTGFYSYGEICSQKGIHKAILHNQTMVITYFTEDNG